MKKINNDFEISYRLVAGFYYRYAFVNMKDAPYKAFLDSSCKKVKKATREIPFGLK